MVYRSYTAQRSTNPQARGRLEGWSGRKDEMGFLFRAQKRDNNRGGKEGEGAGTREARGRVARDEPRKKASGKRGGE